MSLGPPKTGLAAAEQSHDQIVWREDENVYRPSLRPLAELLSTVELIPHVVITDENQDGPLLVFLEQSCMEKMQAHARQEISREQAGILCGQAFSDSRERYYVKIASALPVDAQAGAAHFRFHERSWDDVWQKMEPGSNVIGWYHTHPGMGAFLSPTDLRTQQLYFQSRWQIAVVIDPVRRETRIFFGAAGVKLSESHYFYYLQKT